MFQLVPHAKLSPRRVDNLLLRAANDNLGLMQTLPHLAVNVLGVCIATVNFA